MFANIFQLGRKVRRKDVGGKNGMCVSYDGMRLREIHSILIAISQSNLKYSLPAALAFQTARCCKYNEIVPEWATGRCSDCLLLHD